MNIIIFLSLIFLLIIFFIIIKKVNNLELAKYYYKKKDYNNAILYYLKCIHQHNNVLLNIAHIYHYNIKNIFKALEYYILYYNILKNRNDIVSKKNKLHISNKIKEILELNRITDKEKYKEDNININVDNNIDNYMLNNILNGFDKQNLFSNQPILNNINIQYQENQENQNIVNNVVDNIMNDIGEYTIDEMVDDFTIHRNILNDDQNIHDTYINNTISNSINNIKVKSTETNLSINKINFTINEINDIIKDELDNSDLNINKKNNILMVLDNINTNTTKSYKNNITLSELLVLIFNRIYNNYDITIQKIFLENLIIELNNCVENNNIVCHTGIFNRLVNSINLLDPEVNIKSYDFLNEEIMNKCISIRNALDDNIMNYDIILKNKIRSELNKDYVDSKILTQEQLDDILNIWIDHI